VSFPRSELPEGSEQAETQPEGEVGVATEPGQLKTTSVLSLSQVCPKSVPSHLAKLIMQAATAPGDLLTLMALAEHTNRTRFRKTVLQPLIDAGLLEPTIPDKPRSSKQQYRLTSLGREILKQQSQEEA